MIKAIYLHESAQKAEREVIMEGKRVFRQSLKCFGLFFIFLFILMFRNEKAQAATASLTENPYKWVSSTDVGVAYSTEGNLPSVSGIRITKDNAPEMYGYDVWAYSKDGGWAFQYMDLNGLRRDNREAFKSSDVYIIEFLSYRNWRGRFLLHGKNAALPVKNTPCYSIETIRYQKGQLLSKEEEYSTDSRSEWLDSRYSLMYAIHTENDYVVGDGSANQISYIYNIKTGVYIAPGEAVSLEADGAQVIGKGEAYFDSKGKYKVRKLPVAVKKRDQKVYYFEGWYTEPEAGIKISEGDLVEKGMTLYPHWKAVEQKCNVTCIDILRTSTGEEKLGTNTWQAEYGDTVSGAAAGCTSGAGIYYPGREFVGCSETVVSEQDNTVYRYFQNAMIDVMCIDLVHAGPDTGRQLGNHIWKSEYSTTTSGSVIGCDREVGAYYQGYRYMYCSMKQVGEDGCTVYRYFMPILYNIEFVANCEAAGNMSTLRNLYYGHDYSLTSNSFINRKTITLNPNGQNAVCDTSNQVVYSDFLGWSTVASGGGVQYSDGCTINGITRNEETISLYAVWSDKEVTLTAQPIRQGYEFAGWSEDPLAETGQKQFKVDRDFDLYATWKAVPTTYHIEYYKQKTDQRYELASSYDLLGTTDTEVSVGDIRDLFPGFILDEDSSRLKGIVKADGSLILSAYFRRGKYTVTFDANGGRLMSGNEDMEPITGMFEETITLPEVKLQRTGYDFGGWTDKSDGEMIVANPGEDYRMPNHDQVLYAHWIPRDDTSYKIIPFYENVNGIGYTRGKEVELKGTTAATVKDDLAKQYGTGQSDRIIREIFGEGYRLLEENVLTDTVISPYGNTYVEVYLQREAFDFTFVMKSESGTKILAHEKVFYGQSFMMPYEIKDITGIQGYSDETGEVYKAGDQVTVTASHKFLIYQNSIPTGKPASNPLPGFGDTEEPSGENTAKPSGGSTNEPSGDMPAAGETTRPSGGNTNAPAATKTPGPWGTKAPAPSSGITPAPAVSKTPSSASPVPSSDNPAETGKPSEISKDGMSVISTWAGADRNEIASKLAANAREAFLKKGQTVKKKGLLYRVTKTGVKNRTLRVEGLNKEKKTVKIPAQISLRGYSYQVTQIKNGAFANKKKLQKVIVGKNIKKIGKKAFCNSRKLQQITFQTTGLPNIQSKAWKGCRKGMKIKFSKSCSQMTRRYILKKNAAMR